MIKKGAVHVVKIPVVHYRDVSSLYAVGFEPHPFYFFPHPFYQDTLYTENFPNPPFLEISLFLLNNINDATFSFW